MAENKEDKKKIREEITTEDQKIENEAKSLGFLYLAKSPQQVSKKYLSLITEETAKRYKMAVFERKGNLLKVAMVNPQDIEALNALRFIAEKERLEIEIYLASPEIFKEIIEQYSSTEKAVKDVIESLKEEDVSSFKLRETKEDAKEIIQDAPVSKLAHVIVKHAIDGRASDIHIEPIDEKYRVRFRVDGILYSSLVLPREVGRAVVSRIKILSNLKIDEKRKPQDGRFRIDEEGRTTDFRVSTFPVIEGEKVVMRVLSKDEKIFDLKDLGLLGRNYEILSSKLKDSFGIILITGPTGSGKSTTLYAFLQILNNAERNIVTLEDPVEYFIDGINQSQVKPEIGYTFANGLRAILRQDPNVIMVGEIRDSETAELSIHAALTGHLVFSTLHTNDSIGAIPRLVDMGIEPFLLASSLRAVAAQRLVRRICSVCKREIKIPASVEEKIKKEIDRIPPEEIKKYELDLSQGLKFYEGKGCEECGNLGYKGRMAIFESLEVDETVQEIISEKDGEAVAIEHEVRRKGMLTMKQDGILKVLKGITTLSEVERVTEGSLTIGGEMTDDKG